MLTLAVKLNERGTLTLVPNLVMAHGVFTYCLARQPTLRLARNAASCAVQPVSFSMTFGGT